MIWSGLLLLIMILAPGYGAWLAFGRDLQDRLSAIEAIFLILLMGLIAWALPGFIFAQLGLFNLSVLTLVLAAFTIATVAWAILKNGRSPNPLRGLSFKLADLTPFLLLGLVIIRDLELAALPAESRSLLTNPSVSVETSGLPGPWSEGQRLAGLTIRDASQGIILPHAFHLYPVLIAIFYAVGGLPFALGTTMVLAMLGSLAIYMTGQRLFGSRVALVALLLVVLNVGQMWFVRYPTAEILVRLLFWGGLFTVSLMFTSQSKLAAVIAGASFGSMHLAKLDTVLVFIVLLFFFGFLWLRGRWRSHYSYFAVTYIMLAALSLIHGYFIATIYFIDQTTRELLPSFLARPLVDAATGRPYPFDSLAYLISHNVLLILGGLLLIAIIFFIAVRYRSSIAFWLNSLEWLGPLLKTLIAVGFILLTFYALFKIPFLPSELLPASQSSFNILSWYLTPLGLILGMIGLIQFIFSSKRADTNLTWMLMVGSALPLLLLGSLTASDHFWAVRRYVPVVIPTLLLFASHVLWELVPAEREKWARGLLPLGLGAMLVLGMWQDTSKVVGIVDYEGLTQQLDDLAQRFPTDAVLLFEESDAATRLSLPLWLIWDRTVFTISGESLAQPAAAAAIDHWRSSGQDVYWLTVSENDPETPLGLSANQVTAAEIVVPVIERIRDSIPKKPWELKYNLNIYELSTISD
jgi:hypothetical protein